jgi:hypothetical protein
MSKQDEINSIERTVSDARSIKELGAALERLQSNRDYIAVIKSGYFRDEAVRLVHLRGDPNMQTPERQADILKQIDSIAALSQYFRTLQHSANLADKAIEDGEAVLDELRAEELK